MDKAETNPDLVVENKQNRFGFLSSSKFETIKVFETISFIKGKDQVSVSQPQKCVWGLWVVLYLHARTDLAKPTRVVRDSCIKG
jgi:hypothetical protein